MIGNIKKRNNNVQSSYCVKTNIVYLTKIWLQFEIASWSWGPMFVIALLQNPTENMLRYNQVKFWFIILLIFGWLRVCVKKWTHSFAIASSHVRYGFNCKSKGDLFFIYLVIAKVFMSFSLLILKRILVRFDEKNKYIISKKVIIGCQIYQKCCRFICSNN